MVLKAVKPWFFFLSVTSILPFLDLTSTVHALPANNVIESCFFQDAAGETISTHLEVPPQFRNYTLPNQEGIALDTNQKQSFTVEHNKTQQRGPHLLNIRVAASSSAPENSSQEPQDTFENPSSLFKPDLSSDLPDDLFDLEQSAPENTSDAHFSLSGYIRARGAMDSVDNPGKEHKTAFGNRTLVEAKYDKIITVSALSDFLYFGDDNYRKDYDLDLYEAYATLPFNNLTLTLGKKIIRWGKTDQRSPVDSINPEDFREFIVPDYEDRKIPVWMADLVVKFNEFSLEGAYLPKFEPARQDYFGTDWSVFSHIKEEIQTSSLPDSVKTYVNNITINETSPDDSGLNGELAARASTSIKGWDMGLTYHYAWEDMPFYSNFPIKNFHTNGTMEGDALTGSLSMAIKTNENIEIKYQRVNIVGFEFETILGDFGFRGETVWQDRQSFLTSDLTSEQSPTLFYIVGADYSGIDWYVNLQLSHNHIFDHNDDFLYFEQNTVSVLGEISRKLNSEWLEACLNYSINLNDNGHYLSPRFTYTYITNLDLTVGAHIFEGDPTTFFGRFNNNDQFFLDVTYKF